jgi:hypothetical protein
MSNIIIDIVILIVIFYIIFNIFNKINIFSVVCCEDDLCGFDYNNNNNNQNKQPKEHYEQIMKNYSQSESEQNKQLINQTHNKSEQTIQNPIYYTKPLESPHILHQNEQLIKYPTQYTQLMQPLIYNDQIIRNYNYPLINNQTSLPPPLPPLGPSLGQLMRDYDYKTLEDPLTPPLKRDDWNIPIIPLPTRGYPTSFKKVGTLIDKNADNNDPYKFMFLIGRQKYPGSDYYDYYVTEKNNAGGGTLKFDISKNIRRELFTGDKVNIEHLNKDYEVIADKNLGLEYNPFYM